MKTRQDKEMTDYTIPVYTKNEIELSWQIEMGTVYDKNIINRISLVYSDIEIELSGPIWLGAVCDEYQAGQRFDWSYKYGLHRKWN